ncbi:MAG: hypothetical protein HZC28_17655 [Spirochaetes bacterium]|nr:hypothetical protein [Spirochaetota bacterium]
MRHIHYAFLCAAALLVQPLSAQAPQLRYMVEYFNSAEKPAVISPGANGSGCALLLSVKGKDWSRWNLPRFAAGANTSLLFSVRAAEKPASEFTIRVMEEDGSEWQSAPQKTPPTWSSMKFTAKDFTYYRSQDTRKGSALRMEQVVQIQFVVSGAAAGSGIVLDDVRLDPLGAKYSFEADEHRRTISSNAARLERIGAVLAAYDAEIKRTAALSRWAGDAADEITALLADRRSGESYDNFTARQKSRLKGKPLVLHTSPGGADNYDARPVTEDMLAAHADGSSVPPADIPLRDASGWNAGVLYLAPKQETPRDFAEDGKRGITAAVKFSDAKKQVVFIEGPAVGPVDARPFVHVDVDMRIQGVLLDADTPVLLRLYGEKAPGASQAAFMDLIPERVMKGAWTTLRFPMNKVKQGGGVDLSRVMSFVIRLQNDAGKPSEGTVVITGIRLVPPDSITAAINKMTAQSERTLDTARLQFWRDIGRLNDIRSRAQSDDVVSRYLMCAEARTMTGNSSPVPGALAFSVLASVKDGSGTADVFWRIETPPGSVFTAVIRDHAGAVVASNTAPARAANNISLVIPAVNVWSTAFPYLYRAEAFISGASGIIASNSREIGFRTITSGLSFVTPFLRHAWQPASIDGTMRLNGIPYFALGTHFSFPKGETVTSLAPLVREMWVDALREYGYSFSDERYAQASREGIGYYAAVAGPFKAMSDWGDALQAYEAYRGQLAKAAPLSSHPSVLNWQVGNEVELDMWGASLSAAFPEAQWLPLERSAHVARETLAPATVSYVRAGALKPIPVLPGEDIVGINQYTGRYGGRIEQIGARLDLYAKWCLVTGRTLAITEWNGPQYSWAGNGIGGVTERGSAYYVQRYFESMVDTPGIVYSSEFTLNWLLWRTEDLTTKTKTEEWKDRPPYDQFGGGYTADHVPRVPVDKVYRGEPFRAFMAIQSPIYPLLRTPGDIVIIHAGDAAVQAKKLADALSVFGRTVSLRTADRADAVDAHVILIGGTGRAQPPAVHALERDGCIDTVPDGFPANGLPVIERRLNPHFPARGLVYVSGATAAARDSGVQKLTASADAVKELWDREGAMVRVLAVADAVRADAYEKLLFEFAGRGHILGGDDTRETLDADELLTASGARKAAWWNLHAVILDTPRTLSGREIDGMRRLAASGVRIVISLSCFQSNEALRSLLGVSPGKERSISESIAVKKEYQAPIPVIDAGSVDRAVIDRFQPGANTAALVIRELSGGTPVAHLADGAAIAVTVSRGAENYAVIGFDIVALSSLHRRVAVAGTTSPLYDRDTASGLERSGRLALNLCLAGIPAPRLLPRLRGVASIDDAIVTPGKTTAVTVRLFTMDGKPVAGASVNGTAQPVEHAAPFGKKSGAAFSEEKPGVYRTKLTVGDDTKDGLYVDVKALKSGGMQAVGVAIRAFADGHIAWEGGTSAWIEQR